MTGPNPNANGFEIYKLAVELADRVSARRGTANSYYLTVQTTFLAVTAFAVPGFNASKWTTSVIALAGITLSAAWWLQLRSYRDLNRAKYGFITQLEQQLPAQMFADEWQLLKRDPISWWRPRYAELGTVERVVPVVVALLYGLLLLARILE